MKHHAIALTTILLLALTPASRAAVDISSQSSSGTDFSGTAWAGSLSGSDLINADRATLASATVTTTHGLFPAGGINDGTSANGVPGGNTFLSVADPACFAQAGGTAVATYDLNVTTNTAGYDITSIRSVMGWMGTASQAQANQTYTVAVRVVGSAGYTDIVTVSYTPFADIDGTNYESRVVITENSTGVLAAGVDSIRFTFLNPLASVAYGTGGYKGTLVREIDVHGYPVGGGPSSAIAITNPVSRQVIQRGTANRASVAISGSYSGTPDSIEARMVVMPGAGNSGSDTAWTTLAVSPTGGTLAANLTGVPAGGWYQLEVRLVSTPTPYAAWQIDHWGDLANPAAAWTANPDGDPFANGLEYYLGGNPRQRDAALALTSIARAGKEWRRFEVPLDPTVDSSGLEMWYSFDLGTWHPAATNPGGTVINLRATGSWSLEVSATDHGQAFFRLNSGSQPD